MLLLEVLVLVAALNSPSSVFTSDLNDLYM